jgi:hypothetical protein
MPAGVFQKIDNSFDFNKIYSSKFRSFVSRRSANIGRCAINRRPNMPIAAVRGRGWWLPKNAGRPRPQHEHKL